MQKWWLALLGVALLLGGVWATRDHPTFGAGMAAMLDEDVSFFRRLLQRVRRPQTGDDSGGWHWRALKNSEIDAATLEQRRRNWRQLTAATFG